MDRLKVKFDSEFRPRKQQASQGPVDKERHLLYIYLFFIKKIGLFGGLIGHIFIFNMETGRKMRSAFGYNHQ